MTRPPTGELTRREREVMALVAQEFSDKEIAHKRTGFGQAARPVVVGALAIDPGQRKATVSGREIPLTPTEFKLLTCLAQNAGRVLAWEAILKEVWGSQEWAGGHELVKVTVHRLRAKIEPVPAHPTYLQSVRGIGYRFTSPR